MKARKSKEQEKAWQGGAKAGDGGRTWDQVSNKRLARHIDFGWERCELGMGL